MLGGEPDHSRVSKALTMYHKCAKINPGLHEESEYPGSKLHQTGLLRALVSG